MVRAGRPVSWRWPSPKRGTWQAWAGAALGVVGVPGTRCLLAAPPTPAEPGKIMIPRLREAGDKCESLWRGPAASWARQRCRRNGTFLGRFERVGSCMGAGAGISPLPVSWGPLHSRSSRQCGEDGWAPALGESRPGPLHRTRSPGVQGLCCPRAPWCQDTRLSLTNCYAIGVTTG